MTAENTPGAANNAAEPSQSSVTLALPVSAVVELLYAIASQNKENRDKMVTEIANIRGAEGLKAYPALAATAGAAASVEREDFNAESIAEDATGLPVGFVEHVNNSLDALMLIKKGG